MLPINKRGGGKQDLLSEFERIGAFGHWEVQTFEVLQIMDFW